MLVGSCLNEPRVKAIQIKKKQLEDRAERDEEMLQQNFELEKKKIENELQYLIQDRYKIEARNEKLKELHHGMKERTVRAMASLRQSAEQLTASKQSVYEHLLQTRPNEAQVFLALTDIKQRQHPEVQRENIIKGAQVQDKEKEIQQLKLKNEKMKNELEILRNQEVFIKQYKENPFIGASLLSKVAKQQKVTVVNQDSLLEHSADQVMQQYLDNEDNSKLLQFTKPDESQNEIHRYQ